MRTKPVLLVLLVALAALAFLIGPAAARPAAKTAASLPGSAYPWVYPVWQTVNGVTVVTAPRTFPSVSTQPPPWVFSH